MKCSLHLTHPSAHTWSSGQPTVQRLGAVVDFLPEPGFKPTTLGFKSNTLSIRPRLQRWLICRNGLGFSVIGGLGLWLCTVGRWWAGLWIRDRHFPAVLIFVIIFVNNIYIFTDNKMIKNNFFLNDKHYDVNLLTFSSENKNETEMLGRGDLGRDSFQNESAA